MTWKCNGCGELYGALDDRAPERPFYKPDADWEPEDGRCFECYLWFLADLYGGWMEPCFQVGNLLYTATGVDEADCPAAPHEPDPDLPF